MLLLVSEETVEEKDGATEVVNSRGNHGVQKRHAFYGESQIGNVITVVKELLPRLSVQADQY